MSPALALLDEFGLLADALTYSTNHHQLSEYIQDDVQQCVADSKLLQESSRTFMFDEQLEYPHHLVLNDTGSRLQQLQQYL